MLKAASKSMNFAPVIEAILFIVSVQLNETKLQW